MSHIKSVFQGNLHDSCRFKSFVILLAGFLAAEIIFTGKLSAQGDLMITPRRVVFEGGKRTIDLNLANTGKDTATYAISLVQIRMKEDGGFETITEPDPGQRFADTYIRFFPRSVTLGPNEAQAVKIQLIKSNELQPGEYRSHFYFRSVPKATPLGEKEIVKDSSAISVVLKPIFGITIPAIIRVGESTAKVTITDLRLEGVNDTLTRLKMVFNRSGNMSVFGDLVVNHISPQGKTTRVGIANGVAVYTPNTKRQFQLDMKRMPGLDLRAGVMSVTYSAPSDVKPIKFAEAELQLK